LTENTDFNVVLLGSLGHSTILNEFYGFDGSSPGIVI